MKTYADLQNFVVTLLERDDLTTLLPTFVAMFESDLQSELFDCNELTTGGLLTTSAGQALVNLPGLHVVKSISYQGSPLVYKQGLVPGTATGRPTTYAVEGNTTLRLSPTPDAAYTLDVLYAPIISPLLMGQPLNSDAESWLLTQWPNLYGYGVLAIIYTYLNDDAKLAKFAALYQDAVFKFRRVQKGGLPVALNDFPL